MWDVTITPSWYPEFPLATLMRSPYSWCPSKCPLVTLMALCTLPPISGWAMALIPFATTHPNDIILSAFSSPNQTSQEVTHSGTTLLEACLTVEF